MSDTHVWLRQDDEPIEVYDLFIHYFVPLGPTRTLQRAWQAYMAVNKPEEYKDMGNRNVPANWSEYADQWEWRDRANAYDEMLYSEGGAVDLAISYLKNSTLDAAKALAEALTNPRTQVQAAKEILDRGGIPSVSKHEVNASGITADDLAKAAEELEAWREAKQQSNG